TGSTTYYVELFTERDNGAEPPAFSLYPVPGALDVLVAPEFLEIGRMIELGFPSPDRTTIIGSTHRLYSIHEKIATGRGVYPIEDLHAAARAFSTTLYAFDALALAREHGTEVNAVLLGALAGSGALPIRSSSGRWRSSPPSCGRRSRQRLPGSSTTRIGATSSAISSGFGRSRATPSWRVSSPVTWRSG